MLNKVFTVLECSRVFTLPMTILSWLVVFTYSALEGGNIGYGLLALVGISLAHLATNVLDDYFDYKSLIKQADFDKKEYLKNCQKTKCRYLVAGFFKESDVLILACTYLGIAALTGLFFFLKCGIGVVYFALAGGLIAVLYSFLSKLKLSEVAVALAYGPALFGGVYYVMTKTYSWEVILLSLPTMFMTVILLYIHTVMDFEYDRKEDKQTLATSFDSPLDALVVLKWLLVAAYVSPLLLCIFDILDWQVMLVYLTIPLAVDMYKSMVDFTVNPKSVPENRWFHFPMENKERLIKLNAWAFMIRMYQSRNLMVYFSLLLSLAAVLALG